MVNAALKKLVPQCRIHILGSKRLLKRLLRLQLKYTSSRLVPMGFQIHHCGSSSILHMIPALLLQMVKLLHPTPLLAGDRHIQVIWSLALMGWVIASILERVQPLDLFNVRDWVHQCRVHMLIMLHWLIVAPTVVYQLIFLCYNVAGDTVVLPFDMHLARSMCE